MAIVKVPMKIERRFNSTTPAFELTESQTPADKLFVVYHLGVPAVESAAWHVCVGGLVENPMVLSLSDLNALPKVEVTAFHECAGSPLRPTVPVRRVGNVVWGGVRLRTVLEMARVSEEASHVWARGADFGVYPPTGAHIDSYLKDVPIGKAMADEVLLATECNGMPLDADHGAPIRLVVPGYYGTNSVKWLTEIRVEMSRADGYFTTTLYNDRDIENGVERLTPVWAVAPNTVIVAPAADADLPLVPTRIWGWAWGATEIAAVELSTDGGRAWSRAELAPRNGLAWQRFWLDWRPAAPGPYELVSRAIDKAGASQPTSGARNEVYRTQVRIGVISVDG